MSNSTCLVKLCLPTPPVTYDSSRCSDIIFSVVTEMADEDSSLRWDYGKCLWHPENHMNLFKQLRTPTADVCFVIINGLAFLTSHDRNLSACAHRDEIDQLNPVVLLSLCGGVLRTQN